MGFFDKAISFSSRINDRIYYDHYGSTKNRKVGSSMLEATGEAVMATIAKAGGSDDAARHHAKRAQQAAIKSAAKSSAWGGYR